MSVGVTGFVGVIVCAVRVLGLVGCAGPRDSPEISVPFQKDLLFRLGLQTKVPGSQLSSFKPRVQGLGFRV